jgi:hypothetical protein
MPTIFVKKALEMQDPEDICAGDGYRLLLGDLEAELKNSKAQQVSPEDYSKNHNDDTCVGKMLKSPKQAWVARQFLRQIGVYDEQKKSISAFDLSYAIYDIYGEQFKEDWAAQFLENRSNYSVPERIRIVGAPLLDPASSKSLKTKSLELLHSLAVYVSTLPPQDPAATTTRSIDYYFDQKEPEAFINYLHVSYKNFLQLDAAQKTELFAKAIKESFPDNRNVDSLFPYLTFSEATAFTQECFKADLRASLPLFESESMPKLRSSDEKRFANLKESSLFPNLPQDTPFAVRQKAIDDYLGKPVLVVKTKFWDSIKNHARTTIKKYLWVGNTEVFSMESGRPGPTTLVFSPHFHENNPRKMFHWIKDIPLQSGRAIFIPEANRAMGLEHQDTVAMNRIFNRALSDDRMDYLVVRRVEYLMGLVDGMIGLHDWGKIDPGFISDIIPNTPTGNSHQAGPEPSPWIPKTVQEIGDISHPMSEEEGVLGEESPTMERPPQIQWRVAEQAANTLEKLSGRRYSFVLSPVTGINSPRANNATGYMNFFLRKPAMTFEASVLAEHGQLHAMTVYSLLSAYGHKIDPNFVKVLQNPHPSTNPNLYTGLPISDPQAPNPSTTLSASPNDIPQEPNGSESKPEETK